MEDTLYSDGSWYDSRYVNDDIVGSHLAYHESHFPISAYHVGVQEEQPPTWQQEAMQYLRDLS